MSIHNLILLYAVPVIVIFTKFDALDDVAFNELDHEGVSFKVAKIQTPLRAVTNFEKMYLDRLNNREYPPKGHVYLRGTSILTLVLLSLRDSTFQLQI